VAGQELDDRVGEEVVAVAGNHVSGAADVDERDLGKAGEELIGPGASSPASSIDVNPPNEEPTSTGRGGSCCSTSMTSPAKVATR